MKERDGFLERFLKTCSFSSEDKKKRIHEGVRVNLTIYDEIQLSVNTEKVNVYIELELEVAKQLAESILNKIKEDNKK
jgi:hypothetical protein